MPYVAPTSVSAGDVLTAARYNSDVVGNMADHEARLLDVGLWHISTVSFSATATTVAVADVFSSTYANYRVVADVTPSTTITFGLQMRDGTGVLTAASYNYHTLSSDSSTGGVFANTFNGRSQTTNSLISTGVQFGFVCDFISPNLAAPTRWVGQLTNTVANNSSFVGSYNAVTQLTGFNLSVSTGTATGTIRVYGYNNA